MMRAKLTNEFRWGLLSMWRRDKSTSLHGRCGPTHSGRRMEV